MKAIIECIKKYIKECPYLDELSQINVDYLNMGETDREYWSIEQVDAPIILKKNVLGTKTERQCQFVLASRSFYNTLTDKQNIENLLTFEKIADWFLINSKNNILPSLNDDEISISIEPLNHGALYGIDEKCTLARYQMPCNLIYEKKEENKWNF